MTAPTSFAPPSEIAASGIQARAPHDLLEKGANVADAVDLIVTLRVWKTSEFTQKAIKPLK
jgi:hypothetical protein